MSETNGSGGDRRKRRRRSAMVKPRIVLAGLQSDTKVSELCRREGITAAQQNLLQQQNEAAMAQGDVAKSLIDVYRALGGGWQIRLGAGAMQVAPPPPESRPPEEIPPPADSKT